MSLHAVLRDTAVGVDPGDGSAVEQLMDCALDPVEDAVAARTESRAFAHRTIGAGTVVLVNVAGVPARAFPRPHASKIRPRLPLGREPVSRLGRHQLMTTWAGHVSSGGVVKQLMTTWKRRVSGPDRRQARGVVDRPTRNAPAE